MTPFLRVEHLRKTYRGGRGLADVSFELPPGTIVVLGGPNGSGKSTLLRCLAGLAHHEGDVWLDGHRIDRDPAPRAMIGYLAQTLTLPERASVGEVLDLFADLRGVERSTVPLPSGFVPDDDELIGSLSGGQRHRVALAVALLGEPRLLLLDEPVANLDEGARRAFWRLLRDLRDAGVTSIVSSPSPSELRDIADRWLPMEDGRLAPGDVGLAALAAPDPADDRDAVMEACS